MYRNPWILQDSVEVGAYSQEVGMYSYFGDNPSLGEPTLGNEGYKKKYSSADPRSEEF